MNPRVRRFLALGIIVAGGALIAATVSQGRKQPVAVTVELPKSAKGLRLEVLRERQVVEHLEWSYSEQSPVSQEARLELPPGDYTVSLHAQGAGHDPEPRELRVVSGEQARLTLEVN